MSEQTHPLERLVALRDEAVAAGLVDGTDFAISRVEGELGSECIVLEVDETEYSVLYQDLGQYRRLFGSASFDAARERFLAEAQRLHDARDASSTADAAASGRFAGLSRDEAYALLRSEGRLV